MANTQHLVEKIEEVSFDVANLFTQVPLDKALEVIEACMTAS